MGKTAKTMREFFSPDQRAVCICGSANQETFWVAGHTSQVVCESCGIIGIPGFNKEGAVRAWNQTIFMLKPSSQRGV